MFTHNIALKWYSNAQNALKETSTYSGGTIAKGQKIPLWFKVK